MIENSYYSQDVHGPYELYDVGNLELEEGRTIRACNLAYATFRQAQCRERQRHPHSHLVLRHQQDHGAGLYWSGSLALGPDKYFVIVVNQIGSGLSTSPHNTPAPGGMANFPHVRIGDDVRAQHKLLAEKFDIKSLALVVGSSMGAQQTYEWAVRFPDMVKRAAPIAGTAKNTIHDLSVHGNAGRRHHLRPRRLQPGFLRIVRRREGRLVAPRKNVGGHGLEHRIFPARAAQGAGLFVDGRFHHKLHVSGYFSVMDPNDLLCMAWKWQRGDYSRLTGGDLRAGLGRITAKTFVMPMSSNMFFPPTDCQAEWRLIPPYRVPADPDGRRSSCVVRHRSRMRSVSSIKISASCSRQKPSGKEMPAFAAPCPMRKARFSGGEAYSALAMECGYCEGLRSFPEGCTYRRASRPIATSSPRSTMSDSRHGLTSQIRKYRPFADGLANGSYRPRACQNSAKFCDRPREVRIFMISLSLDGLRARKSERNRSVRKRAGVLTQPRPEGDLPAWCLVRKECAHERSFRRNRQTGTGICANLPTAGDAMSETRKLAAILVADVEQRATIYQTKGIGRPHAQQPSSSIGSFGIPLGDDCRGSG